MTSRSLIVGIRDWLGWYLLYSPAARRHSKVGPPKLWKIKRDFQIQFLQQTGLKPEHHLLDLGCGTLRGGIPVIAYLEKRHYCGVEVRPEVLEEARKELEESNLLHKEPTLIAVADIGPLNLEKKFDYIWAFSVLTHMTDEILHDAISLARRHLKDDGCFYANVHVGNRRERTWYGFPTVSRSLQFYEEACSRNGLRVKDLGSLTDLGHPVPPKAGQQQTGQRMLKVWKA